ncbi:hypothetical protein N9878_00725 [bacterium]|nr:hypothetical protein [bacterium]
METAQELSQTSTKLSEEEFKQAQAEGKVVTPIEVVPKPQVDIKPKGKGGPKPKASQESVDALLTRVESLEVQLKEYQGQAVETGLPEGVEPEAEYCLNMVAKALEKIATYSGHANHLAEFGLKRWNPQAKDMTKHHDG